MNAPLALALAAGMVGAINPCGFSLLPVYLAYFVNSDDTTATLERRVMRAVTAAAMVTVGFIVVFVTLGVFLDSIARPIRPNLPWVTISIGTLVIVAGIAVLAGLKLRIPMIPLRASGGRGPGAVVSYGMVYALASLSCTIGPFLAITSVALDRSLVGGLATYVAYGVGMGVVITVLSAATALARPGPSRRLRSLSRFATRLGGVVMVLSGGYAIWYARWELAVYDGDLSGDPVVDAGERFRLQLVDLINQAGPVRLGLVVAVVVGAVVLAGRWWQRETSQL